MASDPLSPRLLSPSARQALPSSLPRVLWVELTSKCLFDCVFCSRRALHGAGEHMEFGLYERLIAQLERPRVIRLNYSGESAQYPWLGEAIRTAAATGARTELVSTLTSISREQLRGLVDAGLSRLTISLHALDEAKYREIYGAGSVAQLRSRLAELRDHQRRTGRHNPAVDFAFVGMEANLDQLSAVALFAREHQADHLLVHPVIRRADIPRRFDVELTADGALRPAFLTQIDAALASARTAAPELQIFLGRPQAREQPSLGLTTCEQNPWETAHVLANGDVVVCEVRDRAPLGNLRGQSLAEVWRGEAYRCFREAYLAGDVPECRTCPWRETMPWHHVPDSAWPAHSGRATLLRGWHASEGEAVAWSNGDAVLVALQPPGTFLQLRGALPGGPGGNALEIEVDGVPCTTVSNPSSRQAAVDESLTVPGPDGAYRVITLRTQRTVCPAREGLSPDVRELGFALVSAEFKSSRPVVWPSQRITEALEEWATVDRWAARLRRAAPIVRCAGRWRRPSADAGLTVVIPERANPERLARCLAALRAAAPAGEPLQPIVVVNGSDPRDYADLHSMFPEAEWRFEAQPLGFSQAVVVGLSAARHAWTYLLNNDMYLEPDALQNLLPLRAPAVFAIASRIEMADPALTDVETNWTDFDYADGLVLILERDPRAAPAPRGSLYAGGGCALFQTALLRRLIRHTDCYGPFYWEDVEWGARAWRLGFRTLFCPASRARHDYRSTVNLFFEPEEVTRVFERNRLLFHLRNLGEEAPLAGLRQRLAGLDEVSFREIFAPASVGATSRARLRLGLGGGEAELRDRWRLVAD